MADLRTVFLADILEHPQDDFPRLVFADWLMEHGEPERGEFIRIQCELARLGPGFPEVQLTEIHHEPRHVDPWTAPVHFPDPCTPISAVGRATSTETLAEGQQVIGIMANAWDSSEPSMYFNALVIVGEIASGHDHIHAYNVRSGGHDPHYVQRKRLRQRERELLEKHREEWLAHLAAQLMHQFGYPYRDDGPLPDPELCYQRGLLTGKLSEAGVCEFRRGFVDSLTLATDEWFLGADALRAVTPLCAVRLTDFMASLHTVRRSTNYPQERECRFQGRERWHEIPYTFATLEDYALALQAEWPGIKFELDTTVTLAEEEFAEEDG